jgi:endonuclease/exonuclease/phosphatase family metal-dependent hydrolase
MPESNHLTVMTINIMRATMENAAGIGNTIKEFSPDIVSLQEVPYQGETVSEQLDLIAQISGMESIMSKAFYWYKGDEELIQGTAILYSPKLQLVSSGTLENMRGAEYDKASCVYATFEDAINVINFHGVWGGWKTPLRNRQVLAVDELSARLHDASDHEYPLTVLTGDFNAEPESSTVRFLTGLDEIEAKGTFWVDTWKHVGDRTESEHGYTSTAANDLAWKTAIGVGIKNPASMPDRRIDYIMVRGWAYGRRGNPVSSKVVDVRNHETGGYYTDHNAVLSVLEN